ncbi:tetratricopeptide repeat protein [Neisseria subflava]|jgi:putative cysteine-rich protein X|uniref:tetratricopeptide repeat protein n=1 Tax=Neisseria subflava TaxID=28449 RepID=UPI000D314C8A|nr:tetratricopeptide repeat protein [Neisseria subflava]
MENIKIFSNFMKLKKFKNWSVNDLAKEVFNILHDDGICHLSSAEEEDEIRSFCERFSRGLKRLETNDKKEPCVKLYKDKSTKFTWKQYWEAISKEYPDVQSQSEVLDNIDNDKELEIKRIIDKTIETQEILSWDSDLQIYFNAATLFYNNKPKSILDAWELLDKNYNEQNRLENLAEKHNIGSLQTYLGNFYFYKKQKYSKSLEFYKSAAQNYDVLALYQLGQIYEIGVNGHIEKDIDKAMEYYKEATEIDFPFAFNKLAYLSYCTRKYQQFFEYASKSAEINGFNPLPIIEGPIMLDMDGNIKRSNKQQQFPNYLGVLYLGFAYQEGLGVNKNLSKAIQLYEHFLEFPFNHWTQPVLTRLFLLLKECAQNEEDITKAKNAFYKLKELIIKSLDAAWENTDSSILKFEDNLLGLNPDLINDIENAKYFSHDNGSSILLKSIVKRFTS